MALAVRTKQRRTDMDYINYLQVEELLRKYPQLKSLLQNLQLELEKFCRTGITDTLSEEDILYSLAIGNRILSDMPQIFPLPGEKMTNIIEVKDRIIQNEVIKDLIKIINTIGEVVEKVANALKYLPVDSQSVVFQFYCERKTWKQLIDKLNEEQNPLKKRRKEAIYQIVSVLRVTKEQYEFCMNYVKVREG